MKSRTVLNAMWLAVAVTFVTSAETSALNTVRVASGLSRPVFVTAAPGDTSRIFIVEQRSGSTGRIRIRRSNGTLLATPFLSIAGVATGSEQGLLGMAFHPTYPDSPYVYVNYTRAGDGWTVIARYSVSANPDTVDPGSARTLLIIPQPYSNHNGGMLAFSPRDGYLYIGTGDGGDGNDPQNRAQSDTTLLGKMLRIDVDHGLPYTIPADNPFVGPDGIRDEIWAKGLRNPWRYAFDRETEDLIIADVGQGDREEIDVQPAASTGGENYGWRCLEGTRCTGLSGCSCTDTTLIAPIYEYTHGGNPFRCSVTGGYVYRGCAIPGLGGTYFFADYCSNQIWSFRIVDGDTAEFRERTTDLAPGGGFSITSISSFGEDAFGELYICDLNGGEVFKIVPDTLADCNGNGIADGCECSVGVVNDLVCSAAGSDVILIWTAIGTCLQTYDVFRSGDTDTPFPGPGWSPLAFGLPSLAGPNAMTYTDDGIVEIGSPFFYLVTSVCP